MPNIATRTGDAGTTALWSGERVSKTDLRVRAVGEIDLSLSALGKGHKYLRLGDGLAQELHEELFKLQGRFAQVMGEISCSEEKKARFEETKEPVTEADVEAVDALCEQVRGRLNELGRGLGKWKVYGEHGEAAAEFYFIRASFRRTELAVWQLREAGYTIREPILKLLNRSSDLLFYIAVMLED